MKASRKITQKNRKELPLFCFLMWLFVSPCFAQPQGTPTSQQPQQAPPPTNNTTPSSTSVDVGGTLNGSIYTKKFPGANLPLPKGWRAQDGASRQQSAEAAAKTPEDSTDKQSSSQAVEARTPFTYGAEMDFNSRYVWRGLLLGNGPVAQPSAWISAYGFTFIGWGNVALTSRSGGAGLNTGGAGLNTGGAGMNMGGAGLNMDGAGLNMGGLILKYERDWRKLRMEIARDGYTGQQSPGIVAGRMGQQSPGIGAGTGQQSPGIGAGTGQQSSGIVAGSEARSTMEGALKLSYPAGPLRIFTTHAFDVLAYRGSYFGEAGVEYERHVKKNFE